MEREVINVQLTPQERALILQYGYPFPRIELALRACDTKEVEVVPFDVLEFERLIGDLCASINHMRRGRVRNQLIDVCDRLEFALQTGDGMLCEL